MWISRRIFAKVQGKRNKLEVGAWEGNMGPDTLDYASTRQMGR